MVSRSGVRRVVKCYIDLSRSARRRGEGRARRHRYRLPPGTFMATFQPADNLRSRTFLGLLVAQFLAAFNDQAIHASSMIFAINQNALSKDFAISLMPILFYAPWALFCTLAGYL